MLFNSPSFVLKSKEGQNSHIQVCICKNDKSLNEKNTSGFMTVWCTGGKKKSAVEGVRCDFLRSSHSSLKRPQETSLQSFNLSLACQTSNLLKCPLRCEGQFVCGADCNWWDQMTFETGVEKTDSILSCKEIESNYQTNIKNAALLLQVHFNGMVAISECDEDRNIHRTCSI